MTTAQAQMSLSAMRTLFHSGVDPCHVITVHYHHTFYPSFYVALTSASLYNVRYVCRPVYGAIWRLLSRDDGADGLIDLCYIAIPAGITR